MWPPRDSWPICWLSRSGKCSRSDTHGRAEAGASSEPGTTNQDPVVDGSSAAHAKQPIRLASFDGHDASKDQSFGDATRLVVGSSIGVRRDGSLS